MARETEDSVILSHKMNESSELTVAQVVVILGLIGILFSVIFTGAALEMLFWVSQPSQIVFALAVLVASLCFLEFSVKLLKSVWADDGVGLIALVKRACYAIACLELVTCLDALLWPFIDGDVSEDLTDIYLLMATFLKWATPLPFIILMVWGVKKSRPNFILAYNIFKFLHLVFAVLVLGVSQMISVDNDGKGIILKRILAINSLYLYSLSFTNLYYTILDIKKSVTDHNKNIQMI